MIRLKVHEQQEMMRSFRVFRGRGHIPDTARFGARIPNPTKLSLLSLHSNRLNPFPMRCPWCLSFQEYIDYHDTEWGVPVYDDRTHFEFLVLESAQAGLSWATILKRRGGYRRAFAEFDPEVVRLYDSARVEALCRMSESSGTARRSSRRYGMRTCLSDFSVSSARFRTTSGGLWVAGRL